MAAIETLKQAAATRIEELKRADTAAQLTRRAATAKRSKDQGGKNKPPAAEVLHPRCLKAKWAGVTKQRGTM